MIGEGSEPESRQVTQRAAACPVEALLVAALAAVLAPALGGAAWRDTARYAGVGSFAGVPSATGEPAVSVATSRAQSPRPGAFAGVEWRFVRIKYHYEIDETRYSFADFGEPWAIDGPAAEDNLSRRVAAVTAITVGEPLVLELTDKRLWDHPWIYFVEPGNLCLTDEDAGILREFLLRGGTAYFDDFHGPIEWDRLASEMARVFPGRRIVDLEPPHPVYSCFYKLDGYPQVPGLGSFMEGRTWEKGGFDAALRTILDDDGRPMVFINWNTDMGDGWEWSNAKAYPGYVKHTADAYRMTINEIVYALTH
ncbi:MAG: DUF4159 domain-containing protein [Vicinamibacterales bacterium]